MKNKLVTALIFIVTSIGYAQTNIKIYSPLRTHHWNRDKEMLNEYTSTEGGNLGIVLIIETKTEQSFQSLQVGVIKNSFGTTAYLAQYGFGRTLFNSLDVSTSLGLISGYNRLYEINSELKKTIPKMLSSNGIMPSVVLTLTYSKYRVQPTINISPTFINVGIMFRLNKDNK